MMDVHINDFSLQTRVEFLRPCVKRDADPLGLIRQVSEAFGEFIDTQAVTLTSTDDVFAYTLTIPMFKGSAEIVMNAQSITVAFRNGRNAQACGLMIETTCKLLGLLPARDISTQRVSFSCVARFKSLAESEAYEKRFANPEMGITGGGVVYFASGGKVEGELRVGIEKALAAENSVFISSHITTPRTIVQEDFRSLHDRLVEIVAKQELNIILPP